MRRVLVLRPEPGASATLERARERGLDAISRPLFAIEAVDWNMPEAAGFDALLLTSANAVREAGEQLRELRRFPVYAVGEATAEAARKAGFSIAAVGEDGVERLLGSIDAELKLLHLCGEDRRVVADARQRITAVPVYRSRTLDPPDLRDAVGTVALIHSQRAAARFAELVSDRGAISIAGISAEAARAAGPGWADVEAAPQPNDDALLALAARLCDKPHPE